MVKPTRAVQHAQPQQQNRTQPQQQNRTQPQQQNRTQPQQQNRTRPQYAQKNNSLYARTEYKTLKVASANRDLTSANRDLTSAATRGAALAVVSRSNLKTLPPLMLNPHVRSANLCLSARDAYHDGSGATSIQTNTLFQSVQKLMFGENWSATCHTTFGSQTTATDITNGTWLSAPHHDIFWSTLTAIKTMQKDVAHSIVPRFGMKLQPYNFDSCIRAVTHNADPGAPDPSRVIFDFIVDNANLRSPSSKPPTRVSTTNRRVTISEIYDRAGRSYTRERLTKLKEWWAESVHGANYATNTYPNIIIPLDYVGEITIPESNLIVSLTIDETSAAFNGLPKSRQTSDFETRREYGLVKAALLFRFFIPGITVEGVPGVVNSGTDVQARYTYDTYVFIHENGSVSYSNIVGLPNYPDNTEKNAFYTANNPVAPGTDHPVEQATLYNLCKSIGDSAAVWTASVNTFIHTTDTGLIIRCIFNGRYCVISITEASVTIYYIVSPELANELFIHGDTQIPVSPRPILPDQVISATPLTTPLATPLAKGKIKNFLSFANLAKFFDTLNNKLEAPKITKPRYTTPLTLTLRSSINKYNLRTRVGGGGSDGIQQGGAIFTVPDGFDLTKSLNDLLGNAYNKVIFNGENQIKNENQNKTLVDLGIGHGSKLMIFEPKKDAMDSNVAPEVATNVNDAPPLLKISSDACRYFLTLLLYMVSFYSDTPVEDGGINNFALPETTDVVIFHTYADVSKSGVNDAVPNPFQDNAVIKSVVNFISFTEFQPKIQEFLTLLKDFVKVFVSNIALITETKIPPKQKVMPETPSTESAKNDDGKDKDMEIKLNLIRTIISYILGNGGSDDGGEGRGGGTNKIQTDLREVSRACLLPSVLLRIDNINIKNSYLDSDSYKAFKPSILSNDMVVPNLFYLPNATSNIFDTIDNIVKYFGRVFSNSYDGTGIVFEQLPVISPEVKMSVVKALEQFKQEKKMYTMPSQIKFNTGAVTNAKIFDNLCKIIDGGPSNDKTRMKLQELIELQVSAEIQKLNKLAIKGGEDTPSLSEQINNNIEATASDNILREFVEQMANYFVDDEMEDFEKESMKALIDLDATYGFNVEGIDYLHLNDIIYNIFVQEIMYTGVHIHRVDFLQDFINNIGFSSGELMYMDNINDALEASNSISNEKLTELKIKGYSLSEIIGLLYELRDKTTESTSDEDVTSIINGVLNQEVSPVPKPTQQIQPPLDPMVLREVSQTNQLRGEIGVTSGGKNNRISNPKHNTKYRKNYKKFVSKYIIKKKNNNKKNNNKNKNKNNKNNKNKTRKNKRLTKTKPNSKRNNKTLKNKKGKSKLKSNNHKSNHKSKYNNKTKTNYYNFYKHNKTLKH